ncbi:MAG: phosphatase PAP2 family protein [Gelidibacter sp.]|nr:phosphatase PAP2 family protein [Gelidibacter sp.]
MIEQILQYDTELFQYLNGLGTPTWDGFWLTYTTKIYWIPLYVLLLYLMYKKMGKNPFLISILVIALMVLFTDQITNLVKNGFQRLRPCHTETLKDMMRLVRKGCGGQYGFFSGHASNSMAVAFFVGLALKKHYKYLLYLLIIWSVAMGFSRIYVGVHYPLDVLCGALFGALSGFGFYKLDLYLKVMLTNKS